MLYASAVRGGLWKSTDGGGELVRTHRRSVEAVRRGGPSVAIARWRNRIDPDDSDIVYYGTGSSRYGGGLGIFKSIDGGQKWHRIATEACCQGVNEIHVERTSSGVVVYAATNTGLLRHIASDPRVTSITSADWTTLWSGNVEDMAVDPRDLGTVFIADIDATRTTPNGDSANVMKGLYRCSDADSPTRTASCTDLTSGLPPMGTNSSVRNSISFRDDPRTAYASVVPNRAFDATAPRMALYRSDDRGDSWTLVESFGDKKPTEEDLYNPFIRVHPSDSSEDLVRRLQTVRDGS